jgi:hypothetical protein
VKQVQTKQNFPQEVVKIIYNNNDLMKFQTSPEKKAVCMFFWGGFLVAELEGQERFNYTKYLRHPIRLLCFAFACFILGVSVLSSSSLLGSEQIQEPTHNHGRNTYM